MSSLVGASLGFEGALRRPSREEMWARAVWLGLRARVGGRRGFTSEADPQVKAGGWRVPRRAVKPVGKRTRPHL